MVENLDCLYCGVEQHKVQPGSVSFLQRFERSALIFRSQNSLIHVSEGEFTANDLYTH